MKNSIVSLALCAATVSAHFNLDFPTARGFDEDKLGTFPCGGQDTVSKTRTLWPMSGGEIALTMGHSDANIQVLLAMGNMPGSNFNTVIKPTFSETGLGAFCFTVPTSMGAMGAMNGMSGMSGMTSMEGMNATIQVITNGDPSGGLYNCADITFSSAAMAPASSICKNNTGVISGKATSSMSPNMTTAATASTNKKSAGNAVQIGMGIVGIAVLSGFVFLL